MIPGKMIERGDAEESRDCVAAPTAMLPLAPEDFFDHEPVVPGGRSGLFRGRPPDRSGIEFVQIQLRTEGPADPARDAVVAQVSHGDQVGDDPLGKLPVIEREPLLTLRVGYQLPPQEQALLLQTEWG